MTSINKENNIIENCPKEKISFFRGSENDVLSRVLEAEKNLKLPIISLPGDCIIIDQLYSKSFENLRKQ